MDHAMITAELTRREKVIREDALRIQQNIGYILGRINAGRCDALDMYALDVQAAISRLAKNAEAFSVLVGITNP